MTSEIVLAAGQALSTSTSPDLSQPPSFMSVDPRRNWYYYVPVGSPTRRGSSREYTGTVVQKPLADIVRAAQARINAGAATRLATEGRQPTYVRDDGVLDTDTLSAGAQELSLSFRPTGAGNPIVPSFNAVVDALNTGGRTGQLAGGAGMNALTGLILLGSMNDAAGKTITQVDAWLGDGGISLGRSGSTMTDFPRVELTGTLQRSMPRAMNFARRNKIPIAIGGVAVVGLIAAAVYFKNKD